MFQIINIIIIIIITFVTIKATLGPRTFLSSSDGPDATHVTVCPTVEDCPKWKEHFVHCSFNQGGGPR